MSPVGVVAAHLGWYSPLYTLGNSTLQPRNTDMSTNYYLHTGFFLRHESEIVNK